MRGALLLLLVLSGIGSAGAACDWPLWTQYQHDYLSEDGRMMVPTDDGKRTYSESQSYAMFFALVANDRDAFDRILTWTENNLAQGDLTQRLPAWLWGQDAHSKKWQVLDSNSASDADLWIAWNLLEAGRLWHSRDYQVKGTLLLSRIAREETADLPGFGPVLLPGRVGFSAEHRWVINPSYTPPQLMARFAAVSPRWAALATQNISLWQQTAPKGFAPDWFAWQQDAGWQVEKDKGPVGSYDAIRVYLWAGMLAEDAPEKAALQRTFAPMVALTEKQGAPPEKVNVLTGATHNQGNVGFSAALLPLLAHSPAADVQRKRVHDNLPGADAYYSASLTLFGLGWDEQRYRFTRQGELLPAWKTQCTTIN